jgi:hypothetical protein
LKSDERLLRMLDACWRGLVAAAVEAAAGAGAWTIVMGPWTTVAPGAWAIDTGGAACPSIAAMSASITCQKFAGRVKGADCACAGLVPEGITTSPRATRGVPQTKCFFNMVSLTLSFFPDFGPAGLVPAAPFPWERRFPPHPFSIRSRRSSQRLLHGSFP